MTSTLLHFLSTTYGELVLALFLGVCLGLERSFAKKTAGMRTYALVSLGSCLFIIVGHIIEPAFNAVAGSNPLFIAGNIVVGIGFLGGGSIIHEKTGTSGLTTAAGLWVASGIGIAVGFGLNNLAIFATLLTLGVFTILWFIEHLITGRTKGN